MPAGPKQGEEKATAYTAGGESKVTTPLPHGSSVVRQRAEKFFGSVWGLGGQLKRRASLQGASQNEITGTSRDSGGQ